MSAPLDLGSIKTPPRCTADFCLVPIGTGSASVSDTIADVQRLVAASGLTYSMHSAGTTLEGSWDEVMKVIGQAHGMLHDKQVVRVHTDIRVGSRTDKSESMASKVESVQKLLAKDGQ